MRSCCSKPGALKEMKRWGSIVGSICRYCALYHKVNIQPVKKKDTNLCLVCNLHRRNPAGKTNNCEHKYP